MKRVELLAPAGNYESFLGAIHAGADAVYLGGNKFGARAFAQNFSEEEVVQAIKYAHLFKRKVYLTLNTLIKESEFSQVYEYILPFYEAGLDGIIIQDVGVFYYVKEHFPDLALHVSTQMTVTGPFGAEFLKEAGAERVVPARELSLKEIKAIKEKTGLEIEVFIHGAMCYCYSGQCLFSSILGGRSGNRGKCAQPCRLPYEVMGEKNHSASYPLSLKDMCTINHIPALIEAGIDSFKIEGRMKKPEYAAGVTAIYRKYIDMYYESPNKPFKVDASDLKALEALYIRSDIQDGYLYKHNGSEMLTPNSPSYSGSNESLLMQIRKQYLENSKRLPVSIYAYFHEGTEAIVTLSHGDMQVTVSGDLVQKAQKQPVTKENIKDNLSKLGNTSFYAVDSVLDVDENIFYSLKAINELRRIAVSKLEEEILEQNEGTKKRNVVFSSQESNAEYSKNNLKKNFGYHILATSKAQLEAILCSDFPISRLYIDADMCQTNEEWDSVLTRFSNIEIYIATPYIFRNRSLKFMERLLPQLNKVDGCLFRNMETYQFLFNKGYSKKMCSDAGVYIWNKASLSFWQDKISSFCLPYELNRKENSVLVQGGIPCEKVVYGYLPMMLTANCIKKTKETCLVTAENEKLQNKQSCFLKDRYNKKFPVYTTCIHCYNIIYNTVPLSLLGQIQKEQQQLDYRLNFTIESKEEVESILRYFHPQKGNNVAQPFADYTTGHEKRGVE